MESLGAREPVHGGAGLSARRTGAPSTVVRRSGLESMEEGVRGGGGDGPLRGGAALRARRTGDPSVAARMAIVCRRTWRSRLRPQLSQEDASARQRRGHCVFNSPQNRGTPCDDGCATEMGDSDSSAREPLPPMPPNKPPDPTGADGSAAILALKLPCWNCIKPSW